MTSKIILLLIIVVVIAIAVWFIWIRPGSELIAGGQPTSPVLVDIILPQNGTSINQGEPLSVLAQAWSPSPLISLQLWVDGEVAAVENVETNTVPLKVSWDWEASGPGVHSLFVKATDTEGNEGQSPSLLVNINASGFSQVSASGGQTLEEIGGGLGIPVSDLENLNPGLDPQQPLVEGQPVTVPPSPITEGQQGSEVTGGPELVILWQFTPLDQVDESYCYQSLGGDSWQKIPADPFSFFPGDEWLQSYLPIGQQSLELIMECWGWQGGTLKYLGEGQTSLDYAQIPDEIVIVGPGFQMDGLPEQKPLGGGGLPPEEDQQLPPPFALREAETVSECATHYGTNFWANVVCDGLMNSQVKEYYVLVWEWQPKFCWGECPGPNEIDGFLVFELDPFNHTETLVKKIPDSGQKVSAVHLPWGWRCYGVRAYAETLSQGDIFSDVVSYCPGDPPEPEKLVLTPDQWLSTDGDWIVEDCDNYGTAAFFIPSGTQLSVGVYFVDKDDCLKQGDSTAAVKFNLATVGQSFGMTIQRAILRVSQLNVAYSVGSDVAAGAYTPSLCATRLGKAKSDWTGLSSGHFIGNEDILHHKEYYPASTKGFTWLPEGGFGQDVTAEVLSWIENPTSNNGFIIAASEADLYNQYVLESSWDKGTCYSLLEAELEIRYFTPAN